MKPTGFSLVLTVCAALALSGMMEAQDKKPKSSKSAPSEEEMMKKWQEAATPGEPHKMLAEMVGSWETETRMWMNGPGSEATTSKGTADFAMTLDGRFLKQEAVGEMMGQPMTGVGYAGYDNFKKRYTSFWIDNTSTAMYASDGTIDKDGKTITYWGKMDEPMTGEKDKRVKYTETMLDKDHHIFKIYDVTAYGEKTPVVEIKYTRKK